MTGTDHFSVRLPGGFWWEGQRYQEAELRVLTGWDEEYLQEMDPSVTRAEWTTRVLARALERLGPLEPPSLEAVRSLTVGDRQALLLHLRRQMFGEQMPCVLTCPDCEEKMDLELRVEELLLPDAPHEQKYHTLTLQENGTDYRVRFRLPTGADQEAVAALADRDSSRAVDRLVQRCVEELSRLDGGEVPVDRWPNNLQQKLSEEAEMLDPQAELRLNLTCPVCQHEFSSLLDTAAYLADELGPRIQHLYREVHVLALHYHWSEREILAMTMPRRRRYIELINETFSSGQ